MELSSRTAGSTYNNCNVKGEWRSIPNLSPHDRKMFPIHHATNKVCMFIMTSTKFPNLGQKSFQLKKVTFSWSRNRITTVSTGLNSSNCLDTLRPASTLKVLRYSWPLPIIGKKMSKLANDWQKLSNTVKCWQELSNTVKYTVKCCQKLWNIVKWKKWWLIVNHTLWFQWWQSQPCWSGSWWRIPSNRWK